MKTLLHVLLLLCSLPAIVSISGCCRDRDQLHFFLKDRHKEMIPYQNDEIVKFRNSSGDEFEVRIKRTEMTGEYNSGCEECCNSDLVDLSYAEFDSPTSNDLFPVIVVLSKPPGQGSVQFHIPDDFWPAWYRESDARLYLSEDYNFRCLEEDCPKSMTISGQLVEDVHDATMTILDNSTGHIHNFVYSYSKELGLLKIVHEEYRPENNVNILVSNEELEVVL